MERRQMMRGRLRWLKAEEGGLRQPFAGVSWCRPAWIEPGDIEHVASLVIDNIEPRAEISEDVVASWLAWDLLPEPDWNVRAGDVLAITEGTRPVAYLAVQSVVDDEATDGATPTR